MRQERDAAVAREPGEPDPAVAKLADLDRILDDPGVAFGPRRPAGANCTTGGVRANQRSTSAMPVNDSTTGVAAVSSGAPRSPGAWRSIRTSSITAARSSAGSRGWLSASANR